VERVAALASFTESADGLANRRAPTERLGELDFRYAAPKKYDPPPALRYSEVGRVQHACLDMVAALPQGPLELHQAPVSEQGRHVFEHHQLGIEASDKP
jgi:hypothetical protein